jgi:hypothetical protein
LDSKNTILGLNLQLLNAGRVVHFPGYRFKMKARWAVAQFEKYFWVQI